jgi:hypothetical protein
LKFQSRWVKGADLDSRHGDKAWERLKHGTPAEFSMQNGQFQQSDWQSFRMTEIGILRALEYILSILRKIARVR